MTTILVEIKREILTDLLVSALNGGSNYWMEVQGSSMQDGQLEANIEDFESDAPVRYRVNANTMSLGLQRLANRMMLERTKEEWHLSPANAARVFGAAISQSGDAHTADIVLQMGVLGEVLYG
jgi:hypothetical protein